MGKINKMVTGLVLLLLICPLVFGGWSKSTSVPAAEEQRVFDEADLFTETEEAQLQEAAIELAGQLQLDIAIATTDDTGYMVTYEYAESFYMEHHIGFGENLHGILFLIDMDNRQVYIDEYNALEEGFEISTSERDLILDQVMEYMYEGDYYGAGKSFLRELPSYVGNEESGDADYWDAIENGEPEPSYYNEPKLSLGDRIKERLPGCILVSLLIAGITVAVLYFKQRTGNKAAAANYQKGAVDVFKREDRYMNTTVTKTKIETQSNSSGGSHSGGGSSHHGGGHSGGGRSF